MAKIQVFFAAKLQGEYMLDDKFELTVGRGGGCDIVIDNVAVSRHHCTLREVRRKWTVFDEDSANGTFVNGQRVARHELRHKDRVVLGKHTLLFNQYGVGQEAAQNQERAEGVDAAGTMRINSAVLAQMAERSRQQESMGLVLNGPKRRVVALDQGRVAIGKSARCGLRIGGWFVKGEQAHVVKTDAGHKITHAGGWRAMRVNGEKRREAVLSAGDVITIAGNKISYGSL